MTGGNVNIGSKEIVEDACLNQASISRSENNILSGLLYL